MKKRLTLFAVAAVLTTGLGVPAVSAKPADTDAVDAPFAAVSNFAENMKSFVMASFTDDDDDDGAWQNSDRYRHDDDYEEQRGGAYHDDDDCDDGCGSGARNANPAGSVAPPKNGLFGTGTAPAVQVN